MTTKPTDCSINELIKKAKEKGKINSIPKPTIKVNEARNQSKLSNS